MKDKKFKYHETLIHVIQNHPLLFKSLYKQYPNDADLGEFIRKTINKIK